MRVTQSYRIGQETELDRQVPVRLQQSVHQSFAPPIGVEQRLGDEIAQCVDGALNRDLRTDHDRERGIQCEGRPEYGDAVEAKVSPGPTGWLGRVRVGAGSGCTVEFDS